MFYWIFIILILIVVSIYCSKNCFPKQKKAIVVLGTFLTFMSTFRYGLGEDYLGYLYKISWYFDLQAFSLFDEPIFALIAYWINHSTIVTPVFFFGIMAAITLGGIFSFYNRVENSHIIASVIFFCLFPSLFFNTFNLVRQFAATGIFFYSLQFIEKRKIYYYAVCIFLATLIHTSSLILLPLYFLIYKPFNKKVALFYIGSGVLIGYLLPSIMAFLGSVEMYTSYLDSGTTMKSSSMIILYNLLGLLVLMTRNSKQCTIYDNITLNMLFLLIIFSDLSFVNFYFYRISIFFLPIVAYALPRVISQSIRSKFLGDAITIILAIMLFLTFIVPNQNNKTIVPEGLLPPSTLYSQDTFKEYIH